MLFRLLAVLAVLLSLGSQPVQAMHLMNDPTGFCANSSLVQTTCGTDASQDFYLEPVASSKYKIHVNGGNCLTATTGDSGDDVTATTCGSSTTQQWTILRPNSSTPLRQFRTSTLVTTATVGLCLGINPTNNKSNGAELRIAYCYDPSTLWSMDREYVYTQNSTGSNTPVFNVSGSDVGSFAGSTTTVGTQCSCNAFASGAYCALASDHSKAALCRPYANRPVEANQSFAVTTSPAPTTTTPLSLYMRGPLTVISGKLKLASNTTYDGYHFIASSGQCLQFDTGVSNVVIKNSEIGPCTSNPPVVAPAGGPAGLNDRGAVLDGSNVNITFQNNYIHDVSTGILYGGGSGLLVLNNFIGSILGPQYSGSGVQIGSLRPGTRTSKINCNVYHGRYITNQVRPVDNVQDKFNFGGGTKGEPAGTGQGMIEVAYNRIIGPKVGGGDSGSGFEIGDLPTSDFGYLNIHHNSIFAVNGGAMTQTAGSHDIIDNNRVDNRGENKATRTGAAFGWANGYGPGSGGCSATGNCVGVCTDLHVTNNRAIARVWYYTADGQGVWNNYSFANADNNTCTGTVDTGNNFGDQTLGGISLFDEEYSQCAATAPN